MKCARLFAAFTAALAFAACKKDITYHTVTFDGNGGTITGETVITVAKGDKLPTVLRLVS